MQYPYEELKGKIKVGDRVRAVKEKRNACSLLNNDGSNEKTITAVDEYGFNIDFCRHVFDDPAYLDLIYEVPTLETMEVGQLLKDTDGYFSRVLGIIPDTKGDTRCYVVSVRCHDKSSDGLKRASVVFTVFELKKCGFSPVQEDGTPYAEPKPERTVEDVLAGLSEADKEIVKGAMK